MNPQPHNIYHPGIPWSTDLVCILPWNSKHKLYDLKDFANHKAAERISEDKLTDILEDIIEVDNWNLDSIESSEKCCTCATILTCFIPPFCIQWACVTNLKREKYKRKIDERNAEIDEEFEKWNKEIGKPLQVAVNLDSTGYYIRLICQLTEEELEAERKKREELFAQRQAGWDAHDRGKPSKPKSNKVADKRKAKAVEGHNAKPRGGRCNNSFFGGGSKTRAYQCHSCGVSGKADRYCCCCGSSFHGGGNKTAPAYICQKCGYGNGKERCVKCDKSFHGGGGNHAATLCYKCSYQKKKDCCAKM